MAMNFEEARRYCIDMREKEYIPIKSSIFERDICGNWEIREEMYDDRLTPSIRPRIRRG